ncbi:unnamed protein product, partial [Darwinula stevensoni]
FRFALRRFALVTLLGNPLRSPSRKSPSRKSPSRKSPSRKFIFFLPPSLRRETLSKRRSFLRLRKVARQSWQFVQHQSPEKMKPMGNQPIRKAPMLVKSMGERSHRTGNRSVSGHRSQRYHSRHANRSPANGDIHEAERLGGFFLLPFSRLAVLTRFLDVLQQPRRQYSEMFALGRLGYTLGRFLGAGSYGLDREATYTDQDGMETPLACKIMDKRTVSASFAETYIPRELSVLRRMSHPKVVRIHSIGVRPQSTSWVLSAERRSAGDAEPRRPQGQQERSGSHLVLAGVYRDLRTCHRDLKCENLLVLAADSLKIIDFNFTKNSSEDLSETYCGTPVYSAPEILAGVPYETPKVDLWSMRPLHDRPKA